MSDGQAPTTPLTADDPVAPPVAPALVPVIEQRSMRRPAPLWQSIGVALLVLLLLASIGAGVAWANDRWGDAAQVLTAARAFEALVSGDAEGFLALVDGDVRTQVKRADILANERLGRDLRWAGPRPGDGLVSLTVRSVSSPDAPGVATFTPDPQRGDLVRVSASGGPFGEASGTIQLIRTIEGWRITGYRFTGFREPAATPAVR